MENFRNWLNASAPLIVVYDYSFVNIDFYSECKGKPVAEVRFIPVKDDLETLEEALYRADESGVTGENPPTKLVKLN